MSTRIIPFGENIKIKFPTVGRDDPNGDFITSDVLTTADFALYYNTGLALATVALSAISGATVTYEVGGYDVYIPIANLPGTFDYEEPCKINVIDQTATKVTIDTGVEFVFDNTVNAKIVIVPEIKKLLSGFYALPVSVEFTNSIGKAVEVDSDRVTIKMTYTTSGGVLYNLYDDAALTVAASSTWGPAGFRNMAKLTLEYRETYVTYLKVHDVFNTDSVRIEAVYKTNSIQRTIITYVAIRDALNDISTTDVNNTITANTKVTAIKADTTNTLTAIAALNNVSIADILAMVADGTSFEEHLTNLQARTKNTFVKDSPSPGYITYKKKGGASNAYVTKYDTTGRQEQ